MTELTLSLQKQIAAKPEIVFDAWLNVDTLKKFMLPSAAMPECNIQLDPQEGGRFEIIMDVGDRKIPHTGHYLTIDRPNRLVFTWNSPFTCEGSTVHLRFVDSQGGTLVTLRHDVFPSESSRDSHRGGWQQILKTLGDQAGCLVG